MKFTLTALFAMTVTTVVHTAAIPAVDTNWCALPGQPCGQMKRAVSGASEIKRSANALAEAIEDMPRLHIPSWCALPGQICSKFKRAADALVEAAAAVESH